MVLMLELDGSGRLTMMAKVPGRWIAHAGLGIILQT